MMHEKIILRHTRKKKHLSQTSIYKHCINVRLLIGAKVYQAEAFAALLPDLL